MKVLLSIRPEYADRIFRGEKKYEYRKSIFKESIESILVYSTKPVGKIIGEIFIDEIIEGTPDNIWNKTASYSGVSYKFFCDYFNNKERAYAIKIKEAVLFEDPVDPYKENPFFKAPQSFCYIK